MKKRSVIMVMLALLMIFVLVGCGIGGDEDIEEPENGRSVEGEEDPQNDEATEVDEDLPVMTMEEVAENDGRDGANAYVVVEGIVYDVTDSPRWVDGQHNGNQAGQDLTDEILGDSPHGRSVLDRFEAIGRIEE